MEMFSFLPETLQHAAVSVTGLFVGDGWHLTLGAMFMLIVIFLPGGVMEGVNRLLNWVRSLGGRGGGTSRPSATPAE